MINGGFEETEGSDDKVLGWIIENCFEKSCDTCGIPGTRELFSESTSFEECRTECELEDICIGIKKAC